MSLIDAAKKGNVKEVESLLAQGADVNAKDLYKSTPLHKAVCQDKEQEKLVKLLLEHGADPNAKCSNCTPISYTLELYVVSYTHPEFTLKAESLFMLLCYGAILNDNDIIKINAGPKLSNCLTAFNEIKAMPNLGKLIGVNKKRDKKENATAISEYINDKTKQQELIKEFQSIKKYGSDRQLSFIPEYLLDFVQYTTHSYNVREFKINSIDGLVQNTKDHNEQLVTAIPRELIERITEYVSANDAQNSTITCKNVNEIANHTKKKSDMFLTELKEIVHGAPRGLLTEANAVQEHQMLTFNVNPLQ